MSLLNKVDDVDGDTSKNHRDLSEYDILKWMLGYFLDGVDNPFDVDMSKNLHNLALGLPQKSNLPALRWRVSVTSLRATHLSANDGRCTEANGLNRSRIMDRVGFGSFAILEGQN